MSKIKYKVPAGVSAKTKAYINKVLEYLDDSDCFREIDSASMDELAIYYDSFQKFSEIILKEGAIKQGLHNDWKEHPLTKRMHEVQIQLYKIQQEYGLTLRSRSRIITLEDGEEGDESPLEKFLNRSER